MTAPDRPTREQVDATLRAVEQGNGDAHDARLLAVEVRALRAEVDEQGNELTVRRLQDLVAARTAHPADPEARELVARCEGVSEFDNVPCSGHLRYRWGQIEAACDTCGGRCGIAVAAWTRVDPAPLPAVPDEEELPDWAEYELRLWAVIDRLRAERDHLRAAVPAAPDGEDAPDVVEIVGYRWAVRDVWPDGTPYIEHPPPDALARDDGQEWARDVVGHRGDGARLYVSAVGPWSVLGNADDSPVPVHARSSLLRHYLAKTAARLDLPDQARRVTPTADVDEIESVGEAVLAELERLRTPDGTDVSARLDAAAEAVEVAEPEWVHDGVAHWETAGFWVERDDTGRDGPTWRLNGDAVSRWVVQRHRDDLSAALPRPTGGTS